MDKSAWVVFTNQTELPLLRLLKKGYRHCFVLINDAGNWISIDPMANYMDVSIHSIPSGFDMPDFMIKSGHKVIKVNLNNHIDKCAPWMIFTCVEACKRILGIHKRFIFTPWQLYCHLEKQLKTI